MIFSLVLLAAFAPRSGVTGQILEADPFRHSAASFTCQGKPPGYYADRDTGCRTYHVCDGVSHFTYLCPRRTLFRQSGRICDHSYLVRCGEDDELSLRDEEAEEKLESFFKRTRAQESDGGEEEQTQKPTPTDAKFTEIPTTPAATAATTQKAPSDSTGADPEDLAVPSIRNFLKFRVKDPRALFFIPQVKNNSIVVEPGRELVLPLESADLKFRSRKKPSGSSSACPAHCNPRFLLPGTCHPCIMIK